MAKSQFVTMADVAREAGVHVSTVSLSLRNSSLLPETTRRAIQEVATRMNYQPHPDIAALMERRRRRDRLQHAPVVAFVTAGATRDAWRSGFPDAEGLWKGVQKRAAEVGFRVEEFWMEDGKMPPRRFADILDVRAIRGLLLAPTPPASVALDLDWWRFSVAAFGAAATRPLHWVAHDHFEGMLIAMEKCRQLGYRRIGFAASAETQRRDGPRWLAAYLAKQHEWDVEEKLPPLIAPEWSRALVQPWIQRYRPDVILCESPGQVRRTVPAADQLGGVRIITLAGTDDGQLTTGIYPQTELLGGRGIDLLASLLRQNKRGLADNPELLLVPGEWREYQRLTAPAVAESMFEEPPVYV
jgi:DNA-binding LacI/PurR family transcriptional regulator